MTTDVGIPSLLQNLPASRLQSLHLYLPFEDKHGSPLALMLSKCRALVSLHIHTELHFDGGIRDLGEVLKYLPRLCHLDVSRVSARKGGMVSLLLRLPTSPSLEVLDLSRGTSTDIEAVALSTVLSECHRLHTVILHDNMIGNTGACALAESLRYASVTELDLTHNDIRQRGANKLYRAMYKKEMHVNLDLNLLGNYASRLLERANMQFLS